MNPDCVCVCVCYRVELIDPGSQALDQLYSVNNSILLGIEPHLKHYRHLLLDPPKKCSMLTTLGVLEEPFGNARLHACRLMAALLNTRAPRMHQELCRLDMINLLLDLFFKFTWNNFLHVQVEQCVSAILNQTAPDGVVEDSPDPKGSENTHMDTAHTPHADAAMFSHQDLLTHLFQTCRLLQRILDAWEENDRTQSEGGMRRGYMGHLTRIANAVVQSTEKEAAQSHIMQLINGLPEDYGEHWRKFVDETLAETNKKNAVDLVFSDYQIQQMTANFVDQFVFNDDEFGEHDDGINAAFNRMGGIKCNLVDEGPSTGAFQSCTKGKIRPFDDADEEEDIWEDKEINYAAQVKSRTRSVSPRFGVTSTLMSEGGALRRLGSPDLECFPDCKQILDNSRSEEGDKDSSLPQSPGWVASFEDDFNFKADFAGVAIDNGSGVWGSTTAPLNNSEDKGWATFTDFQPFCCSDSGARCSSPVDSENSETQTQDKDARGSAACVWSVCGARKAPLVASDSSSSGSDSEDEEERSDSTSDKENATVSVDTKTEKMPCNRGERVPYGFFGWMMILFFYLETSERFCDQDNAPCHKAEMVQEWFDDHNTQFEVLTPPPNSPDLNPIQHLWDVLDKQVPSMEAPPHNLQNLKDLLLTSWSQIPQNTFRDLVESMPRRTILMDDYDGDDDHVEVEDGDKDSDDDDDDDDDHEEEEEEDDKNSDDDDDHEEEEDGDKNSDDDDDHEEEEDGDENSDDDGGKGRELADMMERRKVDILCVQETRWKGSKARSIGAGFKLFYYGVDSKRNGVGVVLKEEFVRNVLEVKRVSDRVMSLKLEIEGVMLNVVSGYAPQVGCELEEKERFWSELDEVMESIPTGERVVIGADFNGHVGEGNTGDEEVMGKFGVKERNLEGQMVVDFAKRMDMGVVNTYFQKREEHRVTYKSGGRRTQKLRQALGGQVVLPDDWETTAEVIRETGRKVLGVSSGRRKEDKETWWWNEEVQDSIQRKRLAKKKWDMDRTEENRQEYKELQRRVKREVSKAKQKAYDELYTRLDTREGEKDLYRLARQRDRDGKDVQQVKVIKDRDGRVLTSEESVQRRWKEYFEELMNEENEREKRVEGVNSVEQKVDKIRKDEVRKALKRMKSGKAVGPDDIPVEVWKCLGEAAVEFLANLFNRVLESERMPEEWRRSVLVPIFKNKGDVQSCSNYRGIKLMSHTMKVWERVVEARLRKVVDICEQQYGFMPRKSTTDAIFALRILMEKYRDGQRELHCVFVDLEKAYDRVPREELWYCMRKSGVAEKYVRVVQDMYERSRTVVRCAVGQTEEFKVKVGLHQGSALSPFLFAIVMDQLSEEVRQESPWTMMFADDIVICSESREQVEENLERWRFALERRGMKVSRSKTEYMCVNEREGSGTVRLQGEEVKKVQEFKYLGSTVQSNGECGKEVKK
ncbi:hypothetical protein QTP86_022521 [Hemibagrus guttatus]|nr:hypothetical protein QTP86_022521 [Hemibagrus guttatus]